MQGSGESIDEDKYLISSLDASSLLSGPVKMFTFTKPLNYRYIFKSYCRLPLLQCLQLQVIPLIQEVLGFLEGPEKEREQPCCVQGSGREARREAGRRVYVLTVLCDTVTF